MRFCSSPWNTINIGIDGDIFSCTCSAWTELLLGNILTTSLTEIYKNSVELNQLKAGVLDGSFNKCRSESCSLLHSLPSYTSDPFVEFKVDQNLKLPTELILAIDSNCNLRCASCRAANVFSNTPNPQTSKILDILYNDYKDYDKTVRVMLDGAGDVFVSAAYHEFLFNKLPQCWQLTIMTNGNLVLKKAKEIKNISNKISMVTVSLDAATEGTYTFIRGGNFNNVIDGIKMLLDLGIRVNLQFVLQRANYNELLLYKELANKLRVFYGVQKLNRWEHMTDEYWNNNNIDNNPTVDYGLLKDHLTQLKLDRSCVLDGGVQWLLRNLDK